MEDVFKLLKKLKQIEPDKNYTAISRQKILNEISNDILIFEVKNKPSLIKAFRSFSLAFATLIIIVGLFWLMQAITPKLGALNPSIIKTEAEAIDFQIQLSKFIYHTPNSSKILNSILNKKPELENKPIPILPTSTSLTAESTTSLEKITVDEALNYIAK